MSEKTGKIVTNYPLARTIRIAKANGAERIGKEAALLIDAKIGEFVGSLVYRANQLAAHGGRKTLRPEDVSLAISDV